MAEILNRYLAEVAQVPFSYDGNDCGAFAFGWADVATGRDGLKFWRGQYRTEAGCYAAIERWGGMKNWAARFLSDRYGIMPTPFKRCGHIVLADFGGMETMGIRVAQDKIALRSSGVHITARAKVLEEWGVPCLR